MVARVKCVAFLVLKSMTRSVLLNRRTDLEEVKVCARPVPNVKKCGRLGSEKVLTLKISTEAPVSL